MMFAVMLSYAIRRYREMRRFQPLERGNSHGMHPEGPASRRGEHPLESSSGGSDHVT
jgi:hypothetical protein